MQIRTITLMLIVPTRLNLMAAKYATCEIDYVRKVRQL